MFQFQNDEAASEARDPDAAAAGPSHRAKGVTLPDSPQTTTGGHACLLRLAPHFSPKLLEEPCLYNRDNDDLYIVNGAALDFLQRCAAGAPSLAAGQEADFLNLCLEQRILEPAAQPQGRTVTLQQSPKPSLRYLLMHITDRCNLSCRHCYLGEAGSTDLPFEQLQRLVGEFLQMQGLRLMISGGEPMLHPDFWRLNDWLAGKDLRSILLTNGSLLSPATIERLSFAEVQVSLDGLETAHDSWRGHGSFRRALAAIEALAAADRQVSVATMIHADNLADFDALAELLQRLGVREWSIDLPSTSGRFAGAPAVDPRTAGALLNRSYGGAVHEPLAGHACGAHLMAVMADGRAARCGFYADQPVGQISEGLAACWQRVPKTLLAALSCDGQFLEECRGGCRFRASSAKDAGPADRCQCFRYGVLA